MNRLRTSIASRGGLKAVVIAAVVLVPLAFAGLIVAAVANADTAMSRIPAALVNNDELLYQTADDGTETPFFAGRGLVTELTGADDGFDWVITNLDAAEKALAAGDVYAVVTIPKNFSEALSSLQGDDPQAAEISIRTDDSHSYLTGELSAALGDTMAATFGKNVTEQFVSGLYSGLGDLGGSLGDAADGADKLADGSASLGDGITQLADGLAASHSGATKLSTGVNQYTGGVDALSSGLAQLNQGAGGLTALSDGVAQYTGGVSQLSAALSAEMAKPVPDLATIGYLTQQLSGAAAAGPTLSQQAAGAITGIQGGISQSASGAAQLAAGSAGLRSGTGQLAGGLGQLQEGASGAAGGAGELASGAGELASGLRSGAEHVPAVDTGAADATAKVIAEPVLVTSDRDNRIADLGVGISSFFVPLGLWLGAFAVFLVMRPVSWRALTSTATHGRLLAAAFAKAAAVTVGQALLLVGLLHLTLGVAWSALPATLGLSVLMALAFTAIHQLLSVAFGRAGLVVSLLLLALQATTTGGIYPIQLVSESLQWLSPLLPLGYGVSGMQAIVAGGAPSVAVGSAFALLGFGLLAALLGYASLRRIRRIRSLAMLPATA